MELETGQLMAIAEALAKPGNWATVPADLEKLAFGKMQRATMSDEVPVVNMRGQHPLAKWGREKRKEKVKTAAASRRKNRK